VRDAKTIIPERNPRTGQIGTDAERAPPLPMHDDHVCAYRDYWDEQGEKLQTLSMKLLFLKPKAQGFYPSSVQPTSACFEEEEEEKALPDPPKGMITVNDWAKTKGLDLSISQATGVGMRAAKLYEAKYGMPPSQTPSWKGPRLTSNYHRDMRRPWKDMTPSVLPRYFLNTVGEYPRAIIEKAWRMIQAIEKAR
jgi:hypothetical protein